MNDSPDVTSEPGGEEASRRRRALRAALIVMAGCCLYLGFSRWAEIPWSVRRHFDNLAEVEFLTISPSPVRGALTGDPEVDARWDRAAAMAEADRGFGFIADYPILGRSLVSNVDDVMGIIVRADRKKKSFAGTIACFHPRHAIRDPDQPENFILICFECQKLMYQFDGEQEYAQIADVGAGAFDKLADSLGMERSERQK